MTYQELLQQYYAAGGAAAPDMSWVNNTAEMSPQQMMQMSSTQAVQLPDGRMANIGPDGTFTIAQRDPSGNTQTVQQFGADGSGGTPFQMSYDSDNWLRSLAGAAAVGIGGPVLGGLAAGAAPAAAAAPTVASTAPTAAAGGTGLTAGAGGSTGLLAGAGGATGLTAPAVAAGTGAAATGAGMSLGGVGSWIGQNANWLLPALGAVGNSMGGDESRSSGLPEWMQPYAQDYLQRAQQLSQTPFTPYGGQGVAPVNADQQTAIAQTRQLATSGDPNVNAARQQQMNVVQGGMLNSNPYIDQVARGIGDRMGEAYATGTRGNLTSTFAQSGNDPRYSSAYQQTVGNTDRAFADSLGQTMAGLYGDNYRQERAAQDMAARFSPAYAADTRTNTEGLFNAGLLQQQTAQNQNNFDYSQFQQQTQWPFQMNNVLGAAINPQFGQTQTYDDGVPWWARAAGGAAAGYAASRSLYPSQQQTGQSAPFPAYFGPRV